MLFLRHTPGESIKRIGKISRRPSSMSTDITNFEKGVKDVSVNLPDQTVKIVFDESKTDTLTLAKAIRKLGYEAKVIEFE